MNARVSWAMSSLTEAKALMFGFCSEETLTYPRYCSKKCCTTCCPWVVDIIVRACAARSPRLLFPAAVSRASLGLVPV